MSTCVTAKKGLEEIKGQISPHCVLPSTWKSTGHPSLLGGKRSTCSNCYRCNLLTFLGPHRSNFNVLRETEKRPTGGFSQSKREKTYIYKRKNTLTRSNVPGDSMEEKETTQRI